MHGNAGYASVVRHLCDVFVIRTDLLLFPLGWPGLGGDRNKSAGHYIFSTVSTDVPHGGSRRKLICLLSQAADLKVWL